MKRFFTDVKVRIWLNEGSILHPGKMLFETFEVEKCDKNEFYVFLKLFAVNYFY